MKMTLKTFCERFANGEFDSYRLETQLMAGWYDWFCKNSSLPKKTQSLGKKVVAIKDSKRFDNEKVYVSFKNNCPMVGPLYDQFSICDLESGDVLFCVEHLEKGSHGCERAHWELYDADVSFESSVVNGTWRDVMKYFGV